MSKRQRLLASILTKMFEQRNEGMDGCYIDIQTDSICVDGWINHLTPEEVQVLQDLWEKTGD